MKAFGFLFFILTLYTISIFPIHRYSKTFLFKNIKPITLTLISLSLVFSLISQTHLSNSLEYKQNENIIIFNNNEISSTNIHHSHTGKGIIGNTLQHIKINKLENIDAGIAFKGLIPNYIYIILGSLVFLSAISTYILFLSTNRKLKSKILYIPIFGALSFGLIEHTIDGGILDPVTILLLGTFIFFIYPKKTKVIFLYIASSLYIVLSALLAIKEIKPVETSTFHLAAFIGLLIIPTYYLKGYIPKKRKIFYLIASIIFTTTGIWQIDTTRTYRNLKVESPAYIALYKEAPDLEKISNIQDLNIYKIEPQDIKLKKLFKRHNVLDNIRPATIPWTTCQPTKTRVFNFQIKSPDKANANLFSNQFISIKLQESATNEKFTTYKGEIYINECTPRRLNALEESIKTLGLKTFFIANLNET